MRVKEFVDHLKAQFPTVSFYNGTIDKSKKECVGVYARGSAPPVMALGGKENSSYGKLPITILVHWSENSDNCEQKANELFSYIESMENVSIGSEKIICAEMQTSCPVDILRDENNICEMVIRTVLIYSRGG